MPTILGIDPGSRQTGYGFIRLEQRQEPVHIHSGVVCTTSENLSIRLAEIFKALNALIQRYSPDEVAIEAVFLSHNAQSALKLGQARGAAMVAAVQYDLPVYEYSAKQIKQAIVGYGAAEKKQMQLMVRHHLRLQFLPQSDQADALGAALCHAQARQSRLVESEQASRSPQSSLLTQAVRSKTRRRAGLRKLAANLEHTQLSSQQTKQSQHPLSYEQGPSSTGDELDDFSK